jgi:hypothetical protein
LRTIEKRGGLDGFLASSADEMLPSDLVRLKRRIVSATAEKAPA